MGAAQRVLDRREAFSETTGACEKVDYRDGSALGHALLFFNLPSYKKSATRAPWNAAGITCQVVVLAFRARIVSLREESWVFGAYMSEKQVDSCFSGPNRQVMGGRCVTEPPRLSWSFIKFCLIEIGLWGIVFIPKHGAW